MHVFLLPLLQMDEISRFMQTKNMSPDLMLRVKRYFKTYYGLRPLFSERDMLNKMPDALRQEVLVHSVDPVLRL